jgi:hypothetical protein
MLISNIGQLQHAGLAHFLGRAPKLAVQSGRVKIAAARSPLPSQAPPGGRRAAKVSSTGSGSPASCGKVTSPPRSPASKPRSIAAMASEFAHLCAVHDDDLADSPTSAAAVQVRAKAQAAAFHAAVEKSRHPIPPAPPPAGSAAARFLAAVAPKTTGPVQTATGIARPPAPGSVAERWLSVMKKLRGEV